LADCNYIIAGGDTKPGNTAQDRVVITGRLAERTNPDGRVAGSCAIANEGATSDGYVEITGSICAERLSADGSVGVADVVEKRSSADRSVTPAFNVIKKGERTIGCVFVADRVAQKRASACGRIVVSSVSKEGPSARGRIKTAGSVAP
jgi:hypothetical protein